jgi:hypothetical protein
MCRLALLAPALNCNEDSMSRGRRSREKMRAEFIGNWAGLRITGLNP